MSIFAYDDYRLYLQDLLTEKKEKNSRYSKRAWSTKLGIDNTLFHKILKGERNLPQESVAVLSKGLELSPAESEYFQCMVDYDQCGSAKVRTLIRDEMLLLRGQAKVGELGTSEFVQLDFYDFVVLEMTEIANMDFSEAGLKKISFPIANVQNRLKKLLELGLLQEQDGKYSKATTKLKYKVNLSQPEIHRYFKEVNRRSDRHIDFGTPQKRIFRTRILSISKDKGPLFAQMLDRFMGQVDEAFKDDKPKELTACMNMQFFPLWED